MKINIVSNDERYKYVKNLLCNDGYDADLCTPNTVCECEYLLLSVRCEYDDENLEKIFSDITEETVVLCGKDKRIDRHFKGKIIDYSGDVDFLQKNAYLTAESAVSFLHSHTKDSLRNKRVFVSGYGRIGRTLSLILKSLGSDVSAYARRSEVKERIEDDGLRSAELTECINADIVINTVPSPIFPKELLSSLPNSTLLIELASKPYGFEAMDRVVLASGLPGKILPIGAARVVYDTVKSILSKTGEEQL